MADMRYSARGGLAQPRIHASGGRRAVYEHQFEHKKSASENYEKSRRVLCAVAAAEKNLAENFSKKMGLLS